MVLYIILFVLVNVYLIKEGQNVVQNVLFNENLHYIRSSNRGVAGPLAGRVQGYEEQGREGVLGGWLKAQPTSFSIFQYLLV